MSVYSGAVRSITPATNADNWTLVASASEAFRVLDVYFGGESTASVAMQTRWARSTNQDGAPTTGNVAKTDPNSASNTISFVTAFATTEPTLDAGDLFTESWNAHGGMIYWHAGKPEEEWLVIGAATNVNVSCRNSVGTTTSTYGVHWQEA